MPPARTRPSPIIGAASMPAVEGRRIHNDFSEYHHEPAICRRAAGAFEELRFFATLAAAAGFRKRPKAFLPCAQAARRAKFPHERRPLICRRRHQLKSQRASSAILKAR